MARGKRSIDGHEKKKNLGGSVSPDIWQQVEQKRLPPATEQPIQPQNASPAPSSNGEPAQKIFLTKAFSHAGTVNWVGHLVKFPRLPVPDQKECALSARKKAIGWTITRHDRLLGQATWQEHAIDIKEEIDPIVIRSAVLSYAVRAGEQEGVSIRTPDELYVGTKPNVSDREWPYLTSIFKNAGTVSWMSYRNHGVPFDNIENAACALHVRPLLNEELKPNDPVPKNLRWEVTRFVLSGNVLRPERTRILREGLEPSEVLDAIISWTRAAKPRSNEKPIIPNDNILKDLSATLVIDTARDPSRSTRDRIKAAPHPPSQ